MSSKSAVLLGQRQPTVRWQPQAAGNEAPDAIWLASQFGLVPDNWQEDVLHAWFGVRPDGKWAASINGLSVPRQQGKTALLEIYELYHLVALGSRVLHSAHQVKTAQKAFNRLLEFFDNPRQYPELARLVRCIRKANGQESLELLNGGSIEFVARSKGAARGYSVDALAMDECQEFNVEALAAILPTLSAAKNPQQIFTGTVPTPDSNGEVFTNLRNQAIEQRNSRLSWMEWSAAGGDDLDDPQVWAKANPGLGIRLQLETIEDERSVMDDETFARERLGSWDMAGSQAVIDAATWRRIADPNSQVMDPVSFAVDIAPDRSHAAIAAAGVREDGLTHVEIIESRKGTDWVLPYLRRLVAEWGPCAVVADGPAATVVPELAALRVPVYRTGPGEFATACGIFFDRVVNGELRHPDQPLFNAAIEAARKRPLADSWAWGRRDALADITPVVAATLAVYGWVDAQPRRRTGKVRKAMVL